MKPVLVRYVSKLFLILHCSIFVYGPGVAILLRSFANAGTYVRMHLFILRVKDVQM